MKILILSPIDPSALARLKARHDVVVAIGKKPEAVRDAARDRDVIVFRSGVVVDAELMSAAPELALLIRAGSGVDNIDLEYVRARWIRLERIPGPGARAVAELTFGLMLALARRILWADAHWRRGEWVKQDAAGWLLRGKTLGILGAGSIGSEVGEMGAAWGMRAIGCVSRQTDAARERLAGRGIELADFDEVVERSDFLSVHVPLSDGTRGLIGDDVLARMRPGSFLVSTARGGVVDEQALRRHLLAGVTVIGAGLDVHEREGNGHISPLADLSNVVLTPHIGAMAIDAQREIGERVIEIVDAHAAGVAPDPTLAAAGS